MHLCSHTNNRYTGYVCLLITNYTIHKTRPRYGKYKITKSGITMTPNGKLESFWSQICANKRTSPLLFFENNTGTNHSHSWHLTFQTVEIRLRVFHTHRVWWSGGIWCRVGAVIGGIMPRPVLDTLLLFFFMIFRVKNRVSHRDYLRNVCPETNEYGWNGL